MKKTTTLLFAIALFGGTLVSCGNSYDKTPEDWSKEICETAAEHGADSQEVKDKFAELKKYYADEDYRMHDEATTLVGQSCPEVVLAQ
ncbi:MAG: hypothetical protein NXI10_13670 [bacterium]|nr:hypothetical protein [bacterium]